MLISHRHKFIYTKTIKTGGTSVESFFERFCMANNEWTMYRERDEYVSASGIIGYRGANPPQNCMWWNHMPAALIRQRIGEEIWSSYFKFCVVRNPYDKAVSAFYFFHKSGKPANNDRLVRENDLDKERTEFENWLKSAGPPIDRDLYSIDGIFCLDDVVRYEALSIDIERICVRLGLPYNPAWLPSLKAGIRPKNAKVESLYTEHSKKIVEHAYAFELKYFNYSFPAGN